MEKQTKKFSIGLKETRNSEINTTEDMVVEGYAIVFDKPATHGFTEIIDKRALENTDMSDVALRYNHKDDVLILARTRNKSLELKVDEKGLFIRANLIDTQMNKDVYKMVRSKLLDKMSFAFTVRKDEWTINDAGHETRKILEIDKLFDVSIVDDPFYPDTELYARSKNIFENKQKELRENKKKLMVKLVETCL